ncbi:hypothetical protein BC629DRAFT_1589276 [Irpex lacteus]|nr:hypothetical protein BC629DRAFT_1589276 [Irpex lacteus]
MGSEEIEAVQLQQAMNYVQVISVALLVYDWLLVLSDEVNHVWASHWTFVKVLYLWTRYSPIADAILGMLAHFAMLSPKQCRLTDTINSFLIAVGIYSSELVLVWRTFALWQDSKRVRYALGILWLSMSPIGLYFVIAFVSSTVYSSQPFAGQPGCNLVSASSLVAGDFIGLTILEICIVILTVVKGFQHISNTPDIVGVQYVRTLYRDGVLFFVFLAVLSLANVLAPFFGPKSNALLLPPDTDS